MTTIGHSCCVWFVKMLYSVFNINKLHIYMLDLFYSVHCLLLIAFFMFFRGVAVALLVDFCQGGYVWMCFGIGSLWFLLFCILHTMCLSVCPFQFFGQSWGCAMDLSSVLVARESILSMCFCCLDAFLYFCIFINKTS